MRVCRQGVHAVARGARQAVLSWAVLVGGSGVPLALLAGISGARGLRFGYGWSGKVNLRRGGIWNDCDCGVASLGMAV